MKTKTTWLLIATLSSALLAAPVQARDEHHGPRWDRYRDYDYRDRGWRHHEPHYRVYVQPERHYYYEEHNYYRGYREPEYCYEHREYHHHHGHRHHSHHHDHDAYKILGGAILLNEILHH